MQTAAEAEDVLGYQVTTLSAADCAHAITERMARSGQKTWFACLNPHAYVAAQRDAVFADALRSADYLVPDGIGLVVGARLLGKQVKARVTGSDIFGALMDRLSRAGGASVFLLGSTEENLAAMQQKIMVDYPGLRLAGVYSPPFRDRFSDEENAQMIAVVNAAGADALWVGMTAPKQEKWIHEHLPRLNVRFAGAVGAVFDFYTGRIKRPNAFFRDMGLEWLVRLLGEPRRLWRRNALSAPIFFFAVFMGLFGAAAVQKKKK